MKGTKIEKIELEMSFTEFAVMSVALEMFMASNLNQVIKDRYYKDGEKYMGFSCEELEILSDTSVKLMELYSDMDMSLPTDN